MLTPWWLLAGVVATLLIVWLLDRHVSRRRARRLRRLAERCGFRYSHIDRFGLARRVRGQAGLSSEGLRVRDLMYRSDAHGYVYAFTAVGADVAAVVVRARETNGDPRLTDVERGDAQLPLGEQYRRLLHEASSSLSRVPTGER